LRRHRFEAYLDKVFDFSERVSALPEGRQYPQHPWRKVFDAVFLGTACQFASLHEIEAECRLGAFRTRVGLISEDTLRYALQRQEPALVLGLQCEVARRLKRNGGRFCIGLTAGAQREAWTSGHISTLRNRCVPANND
jgi:hypothetical protein